MNVNKAFLWQPGRHKNFFYMLNVGRISIRSGISNKKTMLPIFPEFSSLNFLGKSFVSRHTLLVDFFIFPKEIPHGKPHFLYSVLLVGTQRRFNVVVRRRIDVETTSCVYGATTKRFTFKILSIYFNLLKNDIKV